MSWLRDNNTQLNQPRENTKVTVNQLKADFEKWFVMAFDNGDVILEAVPWDKNGYDSEDVNGMWIAFCAGRLTKTDLNSLINEAIKMSKIN